MHVVFSKNKFAISGFIFPELQSPQKILDDFVHFISDIVYVPISGQCSSFIPQEIVKSFLVFPGGLK